MRLAIAKGKLFPEAVELLARAGFPCPDVGQDKRKLIFPAGEMSFLVARALDVPVYVEHGAADLGIVGKDTLAESGSKVVEILDLRFGKCRFAVAGPPGKSLGDGKKVRVATKFPQVARRFFAQAGVDAEIIHLHGSLELAPQVNLADFILDLVSTGRTLRENNLVEYAEVGVATARLIANPVSFRLKDLGVERVVAAVRKTLEDEGMSAVGLELARSG